MRQPSVDCRVSQTCDHANRRLACRAVTDDARCASGCARRSTSAAAPAATSRPRSGIDETKLSKSPGRPPPVHPGRARPRSPTARASRSTWLLRGDGAPSVTAPVPTSLELRRRREPDDARKRILDAAWTLIAARGHHRVRIADVAEAAGTSSAAVHYHFDDKETLLDEALRHNVELALRPAGADAGRPRRSRRAAAPAPRAADARGPGPGAGVVDLDAGLERGGPRRPAAATSTPAAQDRWYRTVLMTLRERRAGRGVPRDGDPALRARQLTALVDGLGIGVMTGAATPPRTCAPPCTTSSNRLVQEGAHRDSTP